jgi:serine O-acetyltransferase
MAGARNAIAQQMTEEEVAMSHLNIVSETSNLWQDLRAAAEEAARSEARLASLMEATILSHDDIASALSFQIANWGP